MCIALLKSATFKILREDFLLEDFGDSKLTPSFDFKPFELFDFAIEVENNIPLL